MAARLYFKNVPPNTLKTYKGYQTAIIEDIVLAKEMGWTLEYVYSLSLEQKAQIKAVLTAYNEHTGGLKI